MSEDTLMPAPIDNKNILEDFADDICSDFDDGSVRRQTFWRRSCLFLIDYVFGTHRGNIKCVYGEPTMRDIAELRKDLDKVLNNSDYNNRSICKLTVAGKDIQFAFYWMLG